uniref:Uncharacterized protein n=1 Tax=Rhizophora mucronata TaxID=61149 RepID=A0A2P2L8A1_RHIMU
MLMCGDPFYPANLGCNFD